MHVTPFSDVISQLPNTVESMSPPSSDEKSKSPSPDISGASDGCDMSDLNLSTVK